MSAYDEALLRIEPRGPEYGGGLSNHGPMVLEALYHLGRADAVPAWLDRYLPRLEEPPVGRDRAPQLGRWSDFPEWRDRFSRRLAAGDWREALCIWIPQLLPGLMAGATHGLLRTAHATRALLARDTPERRRELAQGLAYWAARYQTLPGEGRPRGRRQASEILASLPEFPRGEGWLITEVVRGLDRRPAYAAAVADLDPAALSLPKLLVAFARRAVLGAEVNAVVYVHLLTASVAVETLARILPEALVADALARLWQVGVALCGCWPIPAGRELPAPTRALGSEALVERAIASGDEHAIKVVDACLVGLAKAGDPILLRAADALIAALEAE